MRSLHDFVMDVSELGWTGYPWMASENGEDGYVCSGRTGRLCFFCLFLLILQEMLSK